jgi:GMP synthase (glutamine-hydrolysing)
VNFANRGRIVIHLMHPPVLIVLHNENSTPGRIGNALRDLGFPLDIRRPRFGDALPNTMAGHAGAVIFGGPKSANDKECFVRR